MIFGEYVLNFFFKLGYLKTGRVRGKKHCVHYIPELNNLNLYAMFQYYLP